MWAIYWIGVVVIFAYAMYAFRQPPDKEMQRVLGQWPYSLIALALVMALGWPVLLPLTLFFVWVMK